MGENDGRYRIGGVLDEGAREEVEGRLDREQVDGDEGVRDLALALGVAEPHADLGGARLTRAGRHLDAREALLERLLLGQDEAEVLDEIRLGASG